MSNHTKSLITTTMEDIEKISKTPLSKNRSFDSGFLEFTPHSNGCSPTSSGTSGARSRTASSSSRRNYRSRADPWYSERRRYPRHSSNNNNNHSDNSKFDSVISESTEEDVTSDSFNSFSDNLGNNNNNNWTSTVLITPASPGLPVFDEDVEMKLVISTPSMECCKTPQKLVSRVSPTVGLNSEDNRKLSRLAISELNKVDIKPKRLNFNQRATKPCCWRSRIVTRSRATADLTGLEYVDFVTNLGEKSNHWRVIEKIFSYLAPKDLCAVNVVSKSWRNICLNDNEANLRRKAYVTAIQTSKENTTQANKKKQVQDLEASPSTRTRYPRKGYLQQLQNQMESHTKRPPNSPPVSPSKVKFHSYVKVREIVFSYLN